MAAGSALTIATITPEQWESCAVVYCRSRAPMTVAKSTGVPIRVVWELVDNGIPGKYPPLRQVYKERKAAKQAEIPPVFPPVSDAPRLNVHVADKPTQAPTSGDDDVDLTSTAPAPAPAPAPTLQPAPLAPIAPPSDDSPTALAKALEAVHRDLARALTRESTLVKSYREQAIGLAAGSQHLIRAFEAIASQLSARLVQAAQRDEIAASRQALANLARIVKIAHAAQSVGREAIELQRLISGLPQSISAQIPGSPTSPSQDLQQITDTLERIQDLRRRATAIDVTVDDAQYEGEEGSD